MKGFSFGSTGVSRPLKRTATEPGLTPARSNPSRRQTPVQSALPIAPLSHWAPGTRGCVEKAAGIA